MNANVIITNRGRYFSREEKAPILPIPSPARIKGPTQQLEAKMAAEIVPVIVAIELSFIPKTLPLRNYFPGFFLAQTLNYWTLGDFSFANTFFNQILQDCFYFLKVM